MKKKKTFSSQKKTDQLQYTIICRGRKRYWRPVFTTHTTIYKHNIYINKLDYVNNYSSDYLYYCVYECVSFMKSNVNMSLIREHNIIFRHC